MRVTDAAVQIHGGYGYTTDFPVERYYRDAQVLAVTLGTRESQRHAIAAELLAEAGD
jgi:alkylation response protein AidB-like acyl-CoA dehydrogenase